LAQFANRSPTDQSPLEERSFVLLSLAAGWLFDSPCAGCSAVAGGSVLPAPGVNGNNNAPRPSTAQKPARDELREGFSVKIMVNLLFKRGTCPAPLPPRSAATRVCERNAIVSTNTAA